MDNIDERYKRGKIYIVKCKYDDTLKYVGSTFRKLNERLSSHRNDKGCSLYEFVKKGDWDNWYIELYEEYPCNNKKELEKREGEVIRLVGTINKGIAGRTYKEWYEVNKEKIAERKKKYSENNKEIIAEKKKIYRENNKEKIAEQEKKYRENNKEKLVKKGKKYYENNKEILAEKRKEKVKCDNCGSIVNRGGLLDHKRTKKCMEYKTST